MSRLGYDTPWWMVVLLGMGIVFLGLGLLVLLCGALRLLLTRQGEKMLKAAPVAVEGESIPDRKRLLAAVAAAIAEAEETDASGFRIVSFRRREQA